MTDVWMSDGSAPLHPSTSPLIANVKLAMRDKGVSEPDVEVVVIPAGPEIGFRGGTDVHFTFRSFTDAEQVALWAMGDVEGPSGLRALWLWARDQEDRRYSIAWPADDLD